MGFSQWKTQLNRDMTRFSGEAKIFIVQFFPL